MLAIALTTPRDIEQGTAKTRIGGYKKLKFCAQQAERDGLHYFWVDTCCIDKTNSVELQEAINSTYKWYKNATKCYVYLPDVFARQGQEWEVACQKSEWFSRGWTLQDLLAPQVVEFFSVEGQKLGDKNSLERQIHQITGITIEALQGKPLSQSSTHERFSWAARRQTTVEEDAVYCLLGVFDVHMPRIYGEGQQKALIRLRREILLQNDPDLYGMREAVWVVPFERNPRCTGHDAELAELERRLTVNAGTTKLAVTGLDGTGKIQLVLELLYRHTQKHRDCSIMWIAAIGKESIEQGYLTIAQQLGLLGHSNHGMNVEELVQDYLSKDTTGPWLLVYDNADDMDLWTAVSTPASYANRDEQNQESFKGTNCLIDCLPRSKQGCVIFTTRNKKVAVMLVQSNVMTVSAMGEEAAAQLFKNLLCDSSLAEDSYSISRLLAELTNLPLAIAQAAACINLNAITISDYVSLLEREEDIADVLSEDFENHGRYRDSKNSTAAVWLVSFEQIRQANPLAIEYLSFMAWSSSRDVPQSLLPPGLSRKKELDAIGTLVAYSFVSRKAFSDALDTHQLVHLATRNMLRTEGSLHERLDRIISRIEQVLPSDNHENRSVWRAYLPHAQQVLAFSMSGNHNEKRTALTLRCGKCLYNDGQWAEAEQLFAQALEIDKIRLGADHPDTLVSMANLALTYMSQGQWEEAEQLQAQVTAARIAKLGASDPSTLTSMSNLASIYRRRERWEEAKQLLVQVVETCKKKAERK